MQTQSIVESNPNASCPDPGTLQQLQSAVVDDPIRGVAIPGAEQPLGRPQPLVAVELPVAEGVAADAREGGVG